jgi:hypothetical protein
MSSQNSNSAVIPNTQNIDGRYFFELRKHLNDDNLINCINKEQRIEINNSQSSYYGTWILFTFKNILLFATDDQKKTYHAFRTSYITNLLDTTFLESNCINCYYNIIGSNSPVSDIDVHIYYKITGETNVNSKYHTDVMSIQKRILSKHHENFNQTLEELFDCNLYLTSFFYYSDNEIENNVFSSILNRTTRDIYLCIPKLDIYSNTFNVNQRKLSCTKLLNIFEYVFKNNIQFPISYLKNILKDISLIFDGHYDFLDITRKECEYSKANTYTQKTMKWKTINAVLQKKNSGELVNSVSKYSRTEKDTYNSFGAAVIHVVNHEDYPQVVEFIDEMMYIDAVFDNLGFIYKLVLEKDKCDTDDFIIVKVCKYLDRICNNIEGLITFISQSRQELHNNSKISKNKYFTTIKNLSNLCNKNRKKLVSLESAKKTIEEVYDGLYNYCSNSRRINRIQMTESSVYLYNFLKYITYFSLDMIYDYDEVSPVVSCVY